MNSQELDGHTRTSLLSMSGVRQFRINEWCSRVPIIRNSVHRFCKCKCSLHDDNRRLQPRYNRSRDKFFVFYLLFVVTRHISSAFISRKFKKQSWINQVQVAMLQNQVYNALRSNGRRTCGKFNLKKASASVNLKHTKINNQSN